MISAFQGRSNNYKLNPYAGLQFPMMTQRCAHTRACINILPIKELHQFFPCLLSNIFGFDHSGGWGLCTFNKLLHSDFPQVLRFLSPDGDIFQLIAKLDAGNFIYEFPIKCLPLPSQEQLTVGDVPPFYANKVQLSYSVDNPPTHIFLSAFEYYLFHFAYFLVHIHSDQWFRMNFNLSDCLYAHLLDTYLCHFLPFEGSIPGPFTSSQLHSSPLHPGHTPPGSNSLSYGSPGSWNGDSYRESSRRVLGLDGSGIVPAMPEDVEASQSEIFIQVLVEFWLNQFSDSETQGDLLSQAQIPTKEHLVLIRCLLKQVHYFSNGSTYRSSSPTSSILTSLTPVTDALRSSIVVVFFQKRLYSFLKYSLKHSPLDTRSPTLRYIVELWLTFIQPWRYLDPTKKSVENKKSFETNPEKWKMFVWDNLPFYTTLLIDFLNCCAHLDLTSLNHILLLYRTTKVFSQTGLSKFIMDGESLLLNQISEKQASPVMKGSPKLAVSSIRAMMINCCGPMFCYLPIFNGHAHVLHLVQSLRQKIYNTRLALSQSVAASVHHSHGLPQPPFSPSLSHSPTASSSPSAFCPPLTSRAPDRPQPQIKKSWLRSAWDSLANFFSEDATYNMRIAHLEQQDDPRTMIELLEKTDKAFATLFKLSDFSPSPVSHDGSPVLGKAVLTTPAAGYASMHTPPVSLKPEYIKGTSNLSPRGKMQVMQGLRKCSNMDIQYMGDPLLQPIRSFENATLVRALHHLSCGLNDRFAIQLMTIGTSKSIFSKLLLQLLAPPSQPAPRVVTMDTSLNQPPSTPISHVTSVYTLPTAEFSSSAAVCHTPRINLRPLASYYTLTYMFVAVLLAWLLSVPAWLGILLVLLFVFLFCCVSLLMYGTSQKNTKKKQ